MQSQIITPEQFNAAGDGVHDDTPAMQAAIDAASSQGDSVVQLSPLATYRLKGSLTIPAGTSGVRVCGPSRIVSDGVSAFVVGYDYVQYAAQAISPATVGDAFVETTDPPSGLSVGDYVFVYTGNTTPNSQPLGSPDSEINQVVSIVGNRINLAQPLCKSYTVERFKPGQDRTNGITSTSHLGPPAALAVRKINPTVNLELDHLTITHNGTDAWIVGDLAVGLSVHHIGGVAVGGFQSMSSWTGTFHDLNTHVVEPYAQWFSVAYGSRDTSLRDSTLTADTFGQIHVTEGAARLNISNLTIRNAPNSPGAENAVISIRGRGYDIHLDNVSVENGPMSFGPYGALWIDDASGSAKGYVFTGTGVGIRNGSPHFTVSNAATEP